MYLEKINLHDANAVCVAVGSALLGRMAIELSLKVATMLRRITWFNAGFKLNFVSSSLDEDNNTMIFVDVTFHVPVCMSYADRCIVVNFIETRCNLAFLSNQSPRNAMAVRSVIDILQENESCKADISRLVKENK